MQYFYSWITAAEPPSIEKKCFSRVDRLAAPNTECRISLVEKVQAKD